MFALGLLDEEIDKTEVGITSCGLDLENSFLIVKRETVSKAPLPRSKIRTL